MLPKVLQGLSPDMQALYRAGEKKTTEAVNKAVEQGVEILAQQFRSRIASSAVDQATRIPVLLAAQLVQHTTIGPDGKAVIDPKWIKEAKHNFPQALVNVAVGEATHHLGKGLPVGKLVGVLVKEEPHLPAGSVKSGHVDAGKGNSPPKAAGAPPAPAPHDDATGTHTPNAKRGDAAAPSAPAPPAPASDPSHSGVRRKPGGGDEPTAAALPLAIAAAGGRYHPAGPSVAHGAQPQPQHLPGQQPPPRATAGSGDGSKPPSGPRPAASPQEAGHPLAPAAGSPERPVASAPPAPPPAASPGSPPGPPAAHDSPAGPPTLPTGTSPSSTPAMREANARVVELRARETRAREHEAAARDRGMRAKQEAEHYVHVCEAARVAAETEARAARRVAKLEAVCNLLSRADPADPVALSKARDELGHAERILRRDAAWAKTAAHDLDYDVPESMKAAETHLPAEAPPAWPVEPAPAGPPANDGPAAPPDSNGPPRGSPTAGMAGRRCGGRSPRARNAASGE